MQKKLLVFKEQMYKVRKELSKILKSYLIKY